MKKSLMGLCAVALMALATDIAATAATIDFEADASGLQANGFSPAGHPGVHFTDTDGADLFISDFSPQSVGQGLAVFSDDASILRIDFDFLVNALSIAFGNDDPDGFAGEGDIALLTLFNGASEVGSAFTEMNLNDIMDQTVVFSGLAFNRALFSFADADGNPIDLIEIVDYIDYTPADIAAGVPEPASLTLIGAGLMGLGGIARRRKGS